jgi:hypothetical protein
MITAAAQYDNDEYAQNFAIPLDDVPKAPHRIVVREGR